VTIFGRAYAFKKAIALGHRFQKAGDETQMKKVITTITALTFALGLASASLAQTDKPAVVEAPKAGEAAKPVTQEEPKAGEKAKSVKAGENGKTKKDKKKSKNEKKPVTPVEKPKAEPKK
jgi:outer membrane biosynthesis protein TonB